MKYQSPINWNAPGPNLRDFAVELKREAAHAEASRFEAFIPRQHSSAIFAIADVRPGSLLMEDGAIHLVLDAQPRGDTKECVLLSLPDSRYNLDDALAIGRRRITPKNIFAIDEVLSVKGTVPEEVLKAAADPVVKHNAEVLLGLGDLGRDFKRAMFANGRTIFLEIDGEGRILEAGADCAQAMIRIETAPALQVSAPYITLARELLVCNTAHAFERVEAAVTLANLLKAAEMRNLARAI